MTPTKNPAAAGYLKSAAIGVAMALCWFAWSFGGDLTRLAAMDRALADLRTCEGDRSCEAAWAKVEEVRSGR